MKVKPVLFIVLTIAIALAACESKAKKAQKYHEKYVHIIQAVIDSSLTYGDGIQSSERVKALKAQEVYSGVVNNAISKVNEEKDFSGDTILQHYSLELLGFYKNSLDNGFKPFLNALKADSFSENEKLTADSLYVDFTSTQSKYWDRFEWAEKQFDKKEGVAKLEK